MKKLMLLFYSSLLVAQTAQVQIIHNSPYPVVDIYVDGTVAIEQVAYRACTGLVDLPINTTVGIAPTGGDVIATFPFTLASNETYVVTASGRDKTHQISARSMIAEKAVPEDPATGSACGCFSAWALEHSYPEFSETKELIVGQGHEIGRPSLLFTNTRSDQIMIGGKVSLVIRGVLGPSLSKHLNR